MNLNEKVELREKINVIKEELISYVLNTKRLINLCDKIGYDFQEYLDLLCWT